MSVVLVIFTTGMVVELTICTVASDTGWPDASNTFKRSDPVLGADSNPRGEIIVVRVVRTFDPEKILISALL